MTGNRIYLDYNASTPIAPEVAEAMRPLLSEGFGNPSSTHWAGVPAKAALERARVLASRIRRGLAPRVSGGRPCTRRNRA